MNATNAGSQARMDIREDEEQEMKCQDVMELFLTAGYFRARIKVCSRFIISAVFYFSKEHLYYIYYYITIILFLFIFPRAYLISTNLLVGWCGVLKLVLTMLTWIYCSMRDSRSAKRLD